MANFMVFSVKVAAATCIYMATKDGWLTAATYLSLQAVNNAIRLHAQK